MNLFFRLVGWALRRIEAMHEGGQCKAISAWSDGVITECQLTSGHSGPHKDDRKHVLNPGRDF
ncbi:hypothetical protein [Prauserella endophytica]|uniref:Uncharacterized protein n=1 Tax=Prauserella endophytica TaxID=1592324 RepID=A0ABY2S058_9PSEU|nr:hypothetical protein [Prauserella endophytica]TKG67023.1 hypothetical protein FCN18_24260 [Prauserella endophytica]